MTRLRFGNLREEFRTSVYSSNAAIIRHNRSIERLIDNSIFFNTQALKRLEDVRKNGPGKLWTWSDNIYSLFGHKQDTVGRRVQAEVKVLESSLQNLPTIVAQSSSSEIMDISHLEDVFVKLASRLAGDK